MQLADVNVLVYALFEASPQHAVSRAWLNGCLSLGEPFAVSDLVLSSVARIATNPRTAHGPVPLDTAISFVEAIRAAPQAVPVAPGPGHWDLFIGLCRTHRIAAGDITDAYLAALAIEHDCEFVTFDKGFGRFRELRLLTLT